MASDSLIESFWSGKKLQGKARDLANQDHASQLTSAADKDGK